MSNCDRLVEGYPRLAAQMGQYPDTAILRRFASLNSQNLLYLQAELVQLEKRLREVESANHRSQDGSKSLYAKDWYWLQASGDDGNDEQWQIVLQARTKLKEYNDALLQQVALASLPEPSRYNLGTLHHWLEAKDLGNLALIGEDQKVWGSSREPQSHASDLVVINQHPMDYFSKWVVESFLIWFLGCCWYQAKRKPAGDVESGVVVYEEDNLLRYTSHATTIIASLLPIVSTVVLYHVQKVEIRLALTAIFTFIFAFCLTLFTHGNKRDVFMAVAAFSAVQVVFISGNGLPTLQSQ